MYVLPIEMVYWQNGKKFHYLRPEREYADKLNFKCPSCLKDAQVLGLREAISAQQWVSVELAPHDFSRAQIVFRAKQPGRME